MTPQCHTLYTVCLFYALNALLMWTVRRERNAERRQAAAALRKLSLETPVQIEVSQPTVALSGF